jgi:glycerol-3-phosphate dehydrogenase
MRSRQLERLAGHRFDVLVVGGGVNGAVAAAALAAGGTSVALVERADFAGLTSQQTSNLVWGGVKYLQSHEVRLVRSLCRGRNELMRAFPTRIASTAYLGVIDRDAPVGRHLVGAGAGLYWLLGAGRTPLPRVYGPRRAARVEPLVATPGLRGAVRYHDARLVDGDARFVWDFVAAAARRGAVAANYVELTDAEWGRSGWRLGLLDRRGGGRLEAEATVLVNAAGPLATRLGAVLGVPTRHRLVLSKGVHLIVPRLGTGQRVVAMFDDDSRPFFVIPLHDRSMIGTTDTRVEDHDVRVEPEDREFLLAQVNRRLALDRPLTGRDVVAERAGVRPLVVPEQGADGSDWLTLSRRHQVEVDLRHRVITILGGKLTDCLNIGNEVRAEVARLGVPVRSGQRWYGEGDPGARAEVERLARDALPAGAGGPAERAALVEALWRRQGAGALAVVAAWRSDPANAAELYPGTRLTRGELAHMARSELVVTLEDLFRRRTPLSQLRSTEQLRDNPATMEVASMVAPDTAGAAVAELFA